MGKRGPLALLLTLAGILGGCGGHDTADETPRAIRLQLPDRWNVATSAPVFSPDGSRFAVLAERITEKEGISDPSAFVWSRPEGERRRFGLRNGDERSVALGREHLITSLTSLFGHPSVIKTAVDGSQERARIPHSGAWITGLDVNARGDAVYVATSDSVRGIIVRLPLGAGQDARVGRSRGALQALRVGGTGEGVTVAMLINNKGVHALRGPAGGRVKVLDFSPADPDLVARSIDLTPDGRRLAVGIDQGTPEAWDVARHHRLRQIPGVSGDLGEVALSPSGKFLALVDRRHSVVILDVNASEVAAVLRPRLPPSHYLMGLAWSARSEVAAATQGGLRSHPVVLLWHVPQFR